MGQLERFSETQSKIAIQAMRYIALFKELLKHDRDCDICIKSFRTDERCEEGKGISYRTAQAHLEMIGL